jgi:hypothetical protein
MPIEIQQYLKSKSFVAIADESPLIRATVGIIITTIFNYDGPANWREILPTLSHFLDSQDYNMLEVLIYILRVMKYGDLHRVTSFYFLLQSW